MNEIIIPIRIKVVVEFSESCNTKEHVTYSNGTSKCYSVLQPEKPLKKVRTSKTFFNEEQMVYLRQHPFNEFIKKFPEVLQGDATWEQVKNKFKNERRLYLDRTGGKI
jgi:hypothetical protein